MHCQHKKLKVHVRNVLRDNSCIYHLKSVDYTKLHFLSELSDGGIAGNLGGFLCLTCVMAGSFQFIDYIMESKQH